MSAIQSYGFLIEVENDLVLHKQLVLQYSISRLVRGETQQILREQLRTLLALYFMYGYSKETKDLAVRMFGIKDESLASMNHDLKIENYLIDDNINKRKKHLNPELLELKEYTKIVNNGIFNIVYQIRTIKE